MPSIVELAKILPPQSYMGEITKEEFDSIISNSVMETKYRKALDRETAYEKLSLEREQKAVEKKRLEEEKAAEKARIEQEKIEAKAQKELAKEQREKERAMKSSPIYKLGKKAGNKVVNKALTKGVNALFGETKGSKKKKDNSIGETLAKSVLKNLFK